MNRFGTGLLLVILVLPSGCAKLKTQFDFLGGGKSQGDLSKEEQADLQLTFARSFAGGGNTDQAVEAYRAAIKNNDRLAEPYHGLAVLMDKSGNCGEAVALYQSAIEREPNNARFHCDLGYSFYLQKRFQEAENSLRKAISLSPSLLHAHTNLGLVLARTGRPQEAFEEFRKAGCRAAEAHANLAHAMLLNEQWDEARRHFEIALGLDPKLEIARRGMQGLRNNELGIQAIASSRSGFDSGRPAHAAMAQASPSGSDSRSIAPGYAPERPRPLPSVDQAPPVSGVQTVGYDIGNGAETGTWTR